MVGGRKSEKMRKREGERERKEKEFRVWRYDSRNYEVTMKYVKLQEAD